MFEVGNQLLLGKPGLQLKTFAFRGALVVSGRGGVVDPDRDAGRRIGGLRPAGDAGRERQKSCDNRRPEEAGLRHNGAQLGTPDNDCGPPECGSHSDGADD